MSKGIAKVTNLGSAGMVMHDDTPDWKFLYEAGTVLPAQYNVGDRVRLPDGRVFHLSKASGTLDTSKLAWTVTGQHITYALCQAAAAIGATEIKVTVAVTDGVAGTGILTEDELRGGQICIGLGGTNQNRGILGNSAVAVGGGTVTIYLDAPLTVAVTTATYVEVMANQYLGVNTGNNGGYRAAVGLPVVAATVGQYTWLQTWGPCWVSPQSDLGNTIHNNSVTARHDGSVDSEMNAAAVGGTAYNYQQQRVGYVLSRARGNTQGAPFIFLMIAP
ncbi:MAG: hypothetical protein IMZ50_10835 [Candidatus Atribacteria bacterium]|nr:hypothetical protein [Candidatus Atribacteria bacterium]